MILNYIFKNIPINNDHDFIFLYNKKDLLENCDISPYIKDRYYKCNKCKTIIRLNFEYLKYNNDQYCNIDEKFREYGINLNLKINNNIVLVNFYYELIFGETEDKLINYVSKDSLTKLPRCNEMVMKKACL